MRRMAGPERATGSGPGRLRRTYDIINAEVASYLNFLRTSAAKAIFERYGFSYLIKPIS